MESRRVFATIGWDGDAGTDSWHDAENWTTNSLPTIDDDVVIEGIDRLRVEEDAVARSAVIKADFITVEDAALTVPEGVTVGASFRDLVYLINSTVSGDFSGGNGVRIDVLGHSVIDGDVTLDAELTVAGTTTSGPATLDVRGDLTTQDRISLGRHYGNDQPAVLVADSVVLVDDASLVTQASTVEGFVATINADLIGKGRLEVGVKTQIQGDVDLEGALTLGGSLQVQGDVRLRESHLGFLGTTYDAEKDESRWHSLVIEGTLDLQADAHFSGSVGRFPANGEFVPLIIAGELVSDPSGIRFTDLVDGYDISPAEVDGVIGYFAPVGPDFVPLGFEVPDVAVIDELMRLRATVLVDDSAPTKDAWRDGIYLSEDAVLDDQDMLLRSVSMNRDAYDSDTKTYSVDLDVAWPRQRIGTHYVIYKANHYWFDGQIESDRNNNTIAKISTASSDLDLVIDDVMAPESIFLNDDPRLPVSVLVSTSGEVKQKPAAVSAYFSVDEKISEDDYRLTLDATRASDEEHQVSQSIYQLNRYELSPGDYFLHVVVNPDQGVFETDYSNNSFVRRIRVLEVPGMRADDLEIQGGIDGQNVTTDGAELSVHFRLQNETQFDSANDWVGSVSLTDSNGDVVVNDIIVPAISPGESDYVSRPLTIPIGLREGDYQVIIKEGLPSEFSIGYSYRTLLQTKLSVETNREGQGIQSFEVDAGPLLLDPIGVSFDVETRRRIELDHALYYSSDPWLDSSDHQLTAFAGIYYPESASKESPSIVLPQGASSSGFLILQNQAAITDDSFSDYWSGTQAHSLAFLSSEVRTRAGVEVVEMELLDLSADEARVRTTFANYGDSTVAGRLRLFGSADVTEFSQDESYGFSTRRSIEPGQVLQHVFTVDYRESLPSPTLFAQFADDPVSDATPTLEVVFSEFDMALENLSVPELLAPGDELRWSIRNLSSQHFSPETTLSVYLSDDEVITAADAVLANPCRIESLDPGGEISGRSPVTNSSFGTGNRYVLFVLHDPYEGVDGPLSITRVVPTEVAAEQLDITEIKLPSGIVADNAFVDVRVKNQGKLAITRPKLVAYVGKVATDLELPHVRAVTTTAPEGMMLEPGESGVIRLTLDVSPEQIGDGFLFVRSRIDQRPFQEVALPQPILQTQWAVENLTVVSQPDGELFVLWRVRNTGNVPARPSNRNRILVSPTSDPDDSITLPVIAEVTATEFIAPGTSYRVVQRVSRAWLGNLGKTTPAFLIAQSGFSELDMDYSDNQQTVEIEPLLADASYEANLEGFVFGAGRMSELPIAIRNLGDIPYPPQEVSVRITYEPRGTDGNMLRQEVRHETVLVESSIAPGESYETSLMLPPLDLLHRSEFTSLDDLSEVSFQAEFVANSYDDNPANQAVGTVFTQIDRSGLDLAVRDVAISMLDLATGHTEVVATISSVGDQMNLPDFDAELRLYSSGSVHPFLTEPIPVSGLAFDSQGNYEIRHVVTLPDWLSQSFTVEVDVSSRSNQLMDVDLTNSVESATFEFDESQLPRAVGQIVDINEALQMVLEVENEGARPLVSADISIFYSLHEGKSGTFFSIDRQILSLEEDPIYAGQSREITLLIEDAEQIRSYSDQFVLTATVNDQPTDPYPVDLGDSQEKDLLQIDRLSVSSLRPFDQQIQIEYSIWNRSSDFMTGGSLTVDFGGDITVEVPLQEAIAARDSLSSTVSIDVPSELSREIGAEHRLGFEFAFGAERTRAERTVRIAVSETSVQFVEAPEEADSGRFLSVVWSAELNPRPSRPLVWEDRIYLSGDGVLDPGDQIVGTKFIGDHDVDVNGVYHAQLRFQLPHFAETKQKFLLILVGDGAQTESSYPVDRVASSPIEVHPARLFIEIDPVDDTGVSDQDGITRHDQPAFRVGVPGRSRVEIDFDGDGAADRSLSPDAQGVFIVRPEAGFYFDEGTHEITAIVLDDSGQTIERRSIAVTIDRDAPVVMPPKTLERALPWSKETIVFDEPVYLSDAALGTEVYLKDDRSSGIDAAVETDGNQVEVRFAPIAVSGQYGIDLRGLSDLAGNRVTELFEDIQVIPQACNVTNVAEPADVNRDGRVTPVDALIVINFLATIRSGWIDVGPSPRQMFDSNCSGSITPSDALYVINQLSLAATGETASFPVTTVGSNDSASVQRDFIPRAHTVDKGERDLELREPVLF